MTFIFDHYADIVMAEEEAEHSIKHRRKVKIGKYFYHSFGERFSSDWHAEQKKKLITIREKFTAIIDTMGEHGSKHAIYVRRKIS